MIFIFDEVIPYLKKAGVTESDINIMMVENAQNWFGGADKN